jgi:hypothetical protein
MGIIEILGKSEIKADMGLQDSMVRGIDARLERPVRRERSAPSRHYADRPCATTPLRSSCLRRRRRSVRCFALRRDEIDGLYNSFHRDNLASIMQHGIVSHQLAERIAHRDIADQGVQETRAGKIVPPDRRPLHSYANLYINPRNIVVYRFIKDTIDAGGSSDDICIVRVSLAVLDIPGVVVTDRNAASWPQWMAPDDGLAALDHSDVFATYWNGKDHAQRMCAEVLVPDRVPPEYFEAVIVCSSAAQRAVGAMSGRVAVEVKGRLYFT